MEAVFLVLVAKLLDPVSFVVVVIVSLFSREKWIIPVAAIVAAIVVETMLTSIQITRTWGTGILPGVIASFIQALLVYGVIGFIRKPAKDVAEDDET